MQNIYRNFKSKFPESLRNLAYSFHTFPKLKFPKLFIFKNKYCSKYFIRLFAGDPAAPERRLRARALAEPRPEALAAAPAAPRGLLPPARGDEAPVHAVGVRRRMK